MYAAEYNSAYNSSPAVVGSNLIPLSKQEVQSLREQSKKEVLPQLINEMLPQLNAAMQGLYLGKRLEEEGQRKIDEGQRQIEQGQRQLAESQKTLAVAQEGHAKAQEKIKELDQRSKELDQRKKEADRKIQTLLTKDFYSIFNGKKELPVDEVNNIFETYVKNSLSVVTIDGKSGFPRIISMNGVIRYLKDHQDVKACDFRLFKTEVNDIPTLAEFLKTSSVKAIVLKKAIPDAAKASLAEAVAARNGGLKVQYFD